MPRTSGTCAWYVHIANAGEGEVLVVHGAGHISVGGPGSKGHWPRVISPGSNADKSGGCRLSGRRVQHPLCCLLLLQLVVDGRELVFVKIAR